MTFMDTGNPAYFNRYTYTANDPINNIDPNGQCYNRFGQAAPQCVEFAVGVGEGLTGPLVVADHLLRLNVGNSRARSVQFAIETASAYARSYPLEALELGADVLASNPARVLGRTAGGSAISLAGSKGTGQAMKNVGHSKKAQKRGRRATSVGAFSVSQYGAAIRGVNGLIDQIEGAGNVHSLDQGTLARATIGAAGGGRVSYDSESGDVTLSKSRTGSRIKERINIGNLRKADDQ